MDSTNAPNTTASEAGATVLAIPTTFPAEIEIPLRLRVRVQSIDDALYYLSKDTGFAASTFIADILDGGNAELAGELLAVNGETQDSIRVRLQAELS